ncbi:hypothetical protein KBD11_02050 [Candidatus Saccharibacteria bacterium]|nr:hypothetical protein [Candidatus Saccharibacteria bacterium]
MNPTCGFVDLAGTDLLDVSAVSGLNPEEIFIYEMVDFYNLARTYFEENC